MEDAAGNRELEEQGDASTEGVVAQVQNLEPGAVVGAGPVSTADGSEFELQLGYSLRFRLLPRRRGPARRPAEAANSDVRFPLV